jgi:hypothetical protein
MKLPETSSAARPPSRHVCLIAILIIGVCGFTLTPTLYLVFRALHWEHALLLVEAAFFPAFFLFGMAALLAYQRSRARQARWHDDP